MTKKRITKRIKECAHGIAMEGAGYPMYHWKSTVLDEVDEPYTEEEYQAAYEWLMKRIA